MVDIQKQAKMAGSLIIIRFYIEFSKLHSSVQKQLTEACKGFNLPAVLALKSLEDNGDISDA